MYNDKNNNIINLNLSNMNNNNCNKNNEGSSQLYYITNNTTATILYSLRFISKLKTIHENVSDIR